MDTSDIERRFDYHAPKDKFIAATHEDIREKCKDLALQIDALLPDSREKSLAITELELVMFWANAGIARILNYQD